MMARMLVWAKSSRTGEYVAGDVICIVENGHQFSASEDPEAWVAEGNLLEDFPGHTKVIDLPSMPVNKANQLLKPKFRSAHIGDREFEAPDPVDRKVVVEKREWKVKPVSETTLDRFLGGSNG